MKRILLRASRLTSRRLYIRRSVAVALVLALSSNLQAVQASEAPLNGASAMGPTGPGEVVVEYFTAIGCEQCMAAHRVVRSLSQRSGVLILAWHVDYWDYLGSKDPFARPESTARQQAYAKAMGKSTMTTPQFVIDGEVSPDRWTPAALTQIISDRRRIPEAIDVRMSRDRGFQQLTLMPRGKLPDDLTLQLVSYRDAEMPDNHGPTPELVNIVEDSIELTAWDGAAPMTLRIAENTKVNRSGRALLVQQRSDEQKWGRIFKTIVLD